MTGALARIVGTDRIMVNSVHSQAIDRPGEGLVVDAVAEDGTIEAVSAPNAPGFVLGLQWHPEWRYAEHPASVAIFHAFGEACRAFQQSSEPGRITVACIAGSGRQPKQPPPGTGPEM